MLPPLTQVSVHASLDGSFRPPYLLAGAGWRVVHQPQARRLAPSQPVRGGSNP